MKKTGFTLIELLVVIAIMAFLAAILVPVFQAAARKAKWAHRLDQIKKGEVQVTADDMARMTPDQRNIYAPGGQVPGSNSDVVRLQIKLDDGRINEISVDVPKGRNIVSVTILDQMETLPSPPSGSELLVPSGQ